MKIRKGQKGFYDDLSDEQILKKDQDVLGQHIQYKKSLGQYLN